MLDLVRGESALTDALRYDYNQIDARYREQVIEAAMDIHGHANKTRDSLLAIGGRLLEVKALLPHGQFQDWVEQEFGIQRRMAENYMAVALRFGNQKQLGAKNEIISFFSPTTMYLLAAPSTPDEAVDAAIAESQTTGQRLKVKRIKEIIAAYTITTDNSTTISEVDATPPPTPSAADVQRLIEALQTSKQALSQALQAAQTVPGYAFSIEKCLSTVKDALQNLGQMSGRV